MSKFLSFFSSDKLLFLGLSAFLLVLIYFKNGEISDLKKELELKNSELVLERTAGRIVKSDLGVCKEKIALQNAEFEALEIKKQDAIKEAKQAKARFEKLATPAKDAQCQERLKFYEDAASVAAKAFKETR